MKNKENADTIGQTFWNKQGRHDKVLSPIVSTKLSDSTGETRSSVNVHQFQKNGTETTRLPQRIALLAGV
jgi:hypothetical protein